MNNYQDHKACLDFILSFSKGTFILIIEYDTNIPLVAGVAVMLVAVVFVVYSQSEKYLQYFQSMQCNFSTTQFRYRINCCQLSCLNCS